MVRKWHYLAVTNSSALLVKKLSNHDGDFYCLNCFSSYTPENKLKKHEEVCNNHDSCHIEIPKWVEKLLKYNPGEKSVKAPFAIYLDLKCLLKKEQSRENNNNNNNNLEKSYTVKKARHGILAGQCLQNVHLIKKKINLIIVEEKIILKNCVLS